MTFKLLPFDRVTWYHSGRKHTRGHAFERDSFVSVCSAVTRDFEAWKFEVPGASRCHRCLATLTRRKLVPA